MKTRRTIKIICKKCSTLLLKYAKGGTGGLVKCIEERIVKDNTKTKYSCPDCNQVFAKHLEIPGKPARKIMREKVIVRGMTRK